MTYSETASVRKAGKPPARWTWSALFMAAAALVAYLAVAQQRETPPLPLNSERIEQRFGSYGIDVLSSDARLRVSELYSLAGDHKVCRTFAVVLYPGQVDPRFADEHAAILAGGSIGAVFKQHGWNVEKRNLYFGTLAPTERIAELMDDDSGRRLAVHVYGLYVGKGETSLPYATIAEVHHPDYLTLARVREIYGEPAAVPAETAGVVQRMLAVTEEQMH
jgi:hypothetical protein